MILLTAALSLVAFHGQTSVSLTSGNTFKATCSVHWSPTMSASQATLSGECIGYIKGIWHSEWMAQADAERTSRIDSRSLRFCVSDGVETDQLLAVSLKYMDDHPEQLHFPAALLIRMALNKAFPCPTSGNAQ